MRNLNDPLDGGSWPPVTRAEVAPGTPRDESPKPAHPLLGEFWSWWLCAMLAGAGMVAVILGLATGQDGWAVAGVFMAGIGAVASFFIKGRS